MEVRTVLVTTDFSDTAREAFQPAWLLAEKFGAALIVAYVEEDRVTPMTVEYTAVGLNDILREQAARTGAQLKEFTSECLGDGCGVELKIATGTPHVEIIRLASECRADLIVMATHGRGGVAHALLGSTTERVLRRAPCPVFVVRARAAQEGVGLPDVDELDAEPSAGKA